MADATSLDRDAYRAGGRLWDFALNNFKRAFRVRDLCDAHLRHHSVSPFHSGARRQRRQTKDRFTWPGKTLEVAYEGLLFLRSWIIRHIDGLSSDPSAKHRR